MAYKFSREKIFKKFPNTKATVSFFCPQIDTFLP